MHGIETLEREYGFASFKIDGEIAHIIDVYIAPEYRRGAYRGKLFHDALEIIRGRGAKVAVGQVQVNVKGSTQRLKFWLTMGAQVYRAANDVIELTKSL